MAVTGSPPNAMMTSPSRSPADAAGLPLMTEVTKMPDADTLEFTLSAPGQDGKEAVMLTINYKRKK